MRYPGRPGYFPLGIYWTSVRFLTNVSACTLILFRHFSTAERETMSSFSRASAITCSTTSGCAAISSYWEAFCFEIFTFARASCLVVLLVSLDDE